MADYRGPDRRKAPAPGYTGPERRKPGRPPLADGQTTSVLCVRVPAGLHDLACKVALTSGVSVSAVIRTALRAHIRTKARGQLPDPPSNL